MPIYDRNRSFANNFSALDQQRNLLNQQRGVNPLSVSGPDAVSGATQPAPPISIGITQQKGSNPLSGASAVKGIYDALVPKTPMPVGVPATPVPVGVPATPTGPFPYAPAPGISGLGAAAGAATGYLQGKGIYEALQGEKLSVPESVALAPLTGGLSLVYNPVKKLLGISGGRSKDAINRQNIRESLAERTPSLYQGEDNSQISFSDGSIYDIRDGRRPGNTRKSIDIDQGLLKGDKQRNEALGAINAWTTAVLGPQNQGRQLAGELYNAVTHDGKNYDQRVNDIFQQGPGWGDLKHSVALRWQDGEISANERDAAFAAIDKQFGVKNESGARWEDQAGLSEADKNRNTKELNGN